MLVLQGLLACQGQPHCLKLRLLDSTFMKFLPQVVSYYDLVIKDQDKSADSLAIQEPSYYFRLYLDTPYP